MSGNEIDEAVSRATGEDLRTIAWLGFVLLDPEPDVSVNDSYQAKENGEIDWDDIDLERYIAMCG